MGHKRNSEVRNHDHSQSLNSNSHLLLAPGAPLLSKFEFLQVGTSWDNCVRSAQQRGLPSGDHSSKVQKYRYRRRSGERGGVVRRLRAGEDGVTGSTSQDSKFQDPGARDHLIRNHGTETREVADAHSLAVQHVGWDANWTKGQNPNNKNFGDSRTANSAATEAAWPRSSLGEKTKLMRGRAWNN